MKKLNYFLALLLMCAISHVNATNYYISPNGNDSPNNGKSTSQPFATLEKAISQATTGDIIFVASGNYKVSKTIKISTDGIKIQGVFTNANNRPLFDFSNMALTDGNRGFVLSADNCSIYGIRIFAAGDNGMKVEAANNNRLEFMDFFENKDTGLQFGNGSANNSIINCDSYFNRNPPTNNDPTGDGQADGFAAKIDVGNGNKFIGCRAWNNSDDGWDGLLYAGNSASTSYENCWAFKNGYRKDGSASTGNGNGFKTGGNKMVHDALLKNCLSFQNRSKGFDQNHNTGNMTFLNCTGFANGNNNFDLDEDPVKSGKLVTLKNCISFEKDKISLPSGAIQSTNSWMSGYSVTSSDFENTTPSGATGARKNDGSLPDISFMHLATGSDLIDRGTIIAGIPYVGTKPDLGCFESKPVNTTFVAGVYSFSPVNNGDVCIADGPTSTVQQICSSNTIQDWQFIASGSLFKVKNISTGQYLYYIDDIANQRIYGTDNINQANTLWKIQYAGTDVNGSLTYNILPATNVALAASNKRPTGINLFLLDLTNSDAQRFIFTKSNSTAREEDAVTNSSSVSGNTSSNLIVYPNPSSHEFNIQLGSEFSYELWNMSGVIVEKGNAQSTLILGSQIPHGIYTLKIYDQNGDQIIKKIVKE